MSGSSSNQYVEVESFQQLVNKPFAGKVNAMCWLRDLEGDFEEVARKIVLKEAVTLITEADLQALELSLGGQKAREIILQDLKLLSDFGADPVLNLIKNYEEDDFFFSTDVYSWHVDRSPIATDTFLCTYFAESSEIIPNDQAIQKVLNPEWRERLLKLYDGPEEGFGEFLEENYFDLHYQALPSASPKRLGHGHLWRLATDNPQSPVLPCIHRAPREMGGLRLLLIC